MPGPLLPPAFRGRATLQASLPSAVLEQAWDSAVIGFFLPLVGTALFTDRIAQKNIWQRTWSRSG